MLIFEIKCCWQKKIVFSPSSELPSSDYADDEDDNDDEQDVDSEGKEDAQKKPRPSWTVVCSTEEEWQQLAESFKKSKHKDEKMLYETLSVDFVPEIGKMIEAKVLGCTLCVGIYESLRFFGTLFFIIMNKQCIHVDLNMWCLEQNVYHGQLVFLNFSQLFQPISK